jgi:hypothetical protein
MGKFCAYEVNFAQAHMGIFLRGYANFAHVQSAVDYFLIYIFVLALLLSGESPTSTLSFNKPTITSMTFLTPRRSSASSSIIFSVSTM